jgi:hypothetical protein
MFIHSIVYVVLTMLTATAAIASSLPVGKAPREQPAPDHQEETIETPQQ